MTNLKTKCGVFMQEKTTSLCGDSLMTHIKVPEHGEEVLHQLWSTPVIMAKPFDDVFLQKLREDIQYLIKDGGIGTFNKTDIWKLPDLPETMIAVRDKTMELAEKAFRPSCEMPLPPFRLAKGYFREVVPHAPYMIMPHRHATTFGVSVFYITASKENAGNLVLLDPRGGINWTNQFTAFKKIRVEEGTLVVHPGYLIHYVEPSNPTKGMFYDYRLAMVSNIHRTQDEWIETLDKYDQEIFLMNGKEN